MKRSFLALLPGLSGLGTSVITEGKSDVFRSWGLAASGLKLGGLEGLWLGRMECHKGMPEKGVLKNAVSVCVFLPWITRTREAGLRLRLSLALQKRHLPSSDPLLFSLISHGFSVTCSPSENSWGTSLCSQSEGLLIQHQGVRHCFLQFGDVVWWDLAVLGLWLTWWS